ncbi:MAG: hypothetical protein QOG55_2996, partial [Acidobacteriaceae bacterium]|nr:hypothetical protein [Acidobacteriaceae bacterium]
AFATEEASMRAMVMESINTRKDRGLIVSEARRRALLTLYFRRDPNGV